MARARFTPLVLLLVLALAAGACAQTKEFDASPAPQADVREVATESSDVPEWVDAGFELARRELERRRPLTRPELAGSARRGLPSEAEFVAILSSAGINPQSARCIYTNISEGAVADNAAILLDSLARVDQTGRGEVTEDVLTGLDQGEIQQLLVALAPCIDGQTLIALLAALGGKSALGDSPLDGLASLSTLSPAQLTQLVNIVSQAGPDADIGALALAAGIPLTPPQIDALRTLALATAARGADALNGLNPDDIDLAALDTENLGPESATQLVFALAAGLTERQRQDLIRLGNVNLADLDLEIDPDEVTSERAGALLVVLLPFISAGSAPNSGGPPPGADPGQVYIPPGTDLSDINPLYFVPRENLIAGLTRDGVTEGTAGCLYDKLRELDPRILALLFTGGGGDGASQLLLVMIGCVLST